MEHKAADVTTLKVKQLKALIQAAGLSHADCFEKSDLRARATQAQAKLAAAPAPKPKKKSLMEIHTAWRAECARAQAEYDATKHRYVERFQNFGRALFKAKRPEDDAEKIFGDARTAEKLLAAGADPDHLLLLGPDQSFHSERGVLLRVDPSCQRRVRTRTFASVHFGAGDPMRSAFEAAETAW